MIENKSNSSSALTLDVLTREEETLIERLVDDELNDEERRALILRLETSVDGWRTCALRFLEAQAFRDAFRNFDESSNAQIARRSNVERKLDFRGLVRAFSATAAGFLVAAFFFGRAVESPIQAPTPSDSDARLVQNDSARLARENSSDVPFQTPLFDEETLNANPGVPLKDSSLASLEVDGLDRDRLNNVVEVKLNCPEQGLTNVTIPCAECDNFDRVGFLTSNLEVPPNVAKELRRAGGRVTSRRDERRFRLDDGRVLIIPVDTYNVDYDANLQVH